MSLTPRPRLLDLCCGAGGCSVGYARAGFDVTGVDREHHSSYPDSTLGLLPHGLDVDCNFVQADAFDVLRDTDYLNNFKVVHISPPCQHYTSMSNRYRGQGGIADQHPDLIAPARVLLQAWGGHYVIENVVGAANEMQKPITLRGGMFGLSVDRPRLFEATFPIATPIVRPVPNPIGVYGARPDGRLLNTRADGTEQRAARSLAEGRAAMGIAWMPWEDLTEAVPPAYTQHIGEQFLTHLGAAA